MDAIHEKMGDMYEEGLKGLLAEYEIPEDIDFQAFKKESDVVYNGRITIRTRELIDNELTSDEMHKLDALFDLYVDKQAGIPKQVSSYEDLLPYVKGVYNKEYKVDEKKRNAKDLLQEAGGVDAINAYIKYINLKGFAKGHGSLLKEIERERKRMKHNIANMSSNKLMAD